MSRQKPLYLPWNEEEFLSDVYVRGMTSVQKWAYRALLQSSFFQSTRPYIPDDDEVLWVLAGCESIGQWRENRSIVLARFGLRTESGLIGNKRVVEDWDKLLETRARMSELGLKSAGIKRTFNQRTTHVDKSLTEIQQVKLSKEKASEKSEVNLSSSLEDYADKVSDL